MSAKVLTVVVGLVVGFLVLGGLLEACGGGSPEPGGQAPSSSAVESSPTVEGSPSAAEPEREDPNRPVVTFTETVTASEPVESATSASGEPESSSSAEGVYYENCDAARAAGAAPLHRGEPGYRDGLDRDGDGVACEPYSR
ncbi:excalibur calcium-binding domain-containing protein [Streptomyces sp. NPDC048566]|uniref:excalibur calcium-binding domain-containing protein n=1 Tax=Streptomyces sp. NPDC048566 TaxID=3365569 RepID=UPI00371AEDB8